MPAVNQLDIWLNHRITTSPNAGHWWQVKVRAKTMLAASTNPERLARRMLAVLLTSERLAA